MFDGKPGQFLPATPAEPDWRTFTPGRGGLRKLAWVLRHLHEILPNHTYDHSRIERDVRCGTAGCAYGVCRIIWPKQFKASGFPQAKADRNFLKGAYDRFFHETAYEKPVSAVTESDVADAIDAYLARTEDALQAEQRR